MAITQNTLNDPSALMTMQEVDAEQARITSLNDPNSLEPITPETPVEKDIEDIDPNDFEVPKGWKDRPQMKKQETSILDDIGDFASEYYSNLKSGDSFALVQNAWRTLFDSARVAVPIKDEDGNTIGSRPENDQEHKERLQMNQEIRKKGLDETSAAAVAAKATQVLIDPSTWAVPLWGEYKAITSGATLLKESAKVATVSAPLASIDMVAYQKATEGEIKPKEVGLVAALATVMGPTVFLAAGKIGETFASKFLQTGDKDLALKDATKTLEEYIQDIPRLTDKDLIPKVIDPKLLPPPSKMGHAPVQVPPKQIREVPGIKSTPAITRAAQKQKMWEEKEMTAFYKKEKEIEEGFDMLQMKEPNAVKFKMTAKVDGADKPIERIISDVSHPDSIMARAFARSAQKEEKIINKLAQKQGGEMNEEVLIRMGLSSAGAALGGYYGGPEGAAGGALLGLSPYKSAGKILGALSKWSREDAATVASNAYFASKPLFVLKSFGKPGRHLAYLMKRAQQNIDLAFGKQMTRLEGHISHLSKDDMKGVERLLQHTERVTRNTPKHIVEAAKAIRKELNLVIEQGTKVGLFSKEAGQKLIEKAVKKGYWPRVYDEAYLSTGPGKKAWSEMWANNSKMDKETFEAALSSILGEDKKLLAKFMKVAKVNNSVYSLPEHSAIELLGLKRVMTKHGRSTHLERARKLHPKAEELLEPFLIKDPKVVLGKYFQDVHRRIEFARIFDRVDDKGVLQTDFIANKMIDEIHAERGTKDAEMVRQLYYTMVGDQASFVIRQQVNLSDRARKFYEVVDTYETVTKLGMAQMPNALQASVNGITYMLNKTSGNPYRSFANFTKGLIRSLGKDGKHFADSIGAARETTMMEMAGEASHVTKFAEGFLKITGFLRVEKFQRRLGANIGKVYAEDVMRRVAKVQAGSIKGSKAKRILKEAKEIGLPVNRNPNVSDIERAGLEFSNMVNFRNTPDQLPLAWQSPHAKLFKKFKTFAFHQGHFVKENVIKPALRGNVMPLLWYSAPAAGLGMGIDELRRMIKGDDRDLTMTERYLRGVTMIGGLGLIGDLMGSVAKDPGLGAASTLGPAISDLYRTGHGAAKAIEKGDLTPLAKYYGKTIVAPGRDAILEEMSNEGRKRGFSRSSGGRSGSRGGSR